MEFSQKHILIFLTLTTILLSHAQSTYSAFKISSEAIDLWESELSYDDSEGTAEEIGIDGGSNRRSLLWGRGGMFPYYISYGALIANRVPCPPRSGRSYYTHNCYKASGPVHPYTRGCSAITRCRR